MARARATNFSEQKLIAWLYKKGAHIRDIAKATGRSRDTISRIVKTFKLKKHSRYKYEITATHKRCSRCKELLPFGRFYFLKDKKCYHATCRRCHSAQVAAKRLEARIVTEDAG
jgi:hypothetical protein